MDDLNDLAVSKQFKSVHPIGNPISNSTNRGFKGPFFPVRICTSPSRFLLALHPDFARDLVELHGLGVLILGKSGIGKSEAALDLVSRGHRLVADDVVVVRRISPSVLRGRAAHLIGHHMEIRGVGLIDITALFGIRAVRQQKRIEVVVQLEDWESAQAAERTGLVQDETTILEVPLP